jgi:hypothetical protein
MIVANAGRDVVDAGGAKDEGVFQRTYETVWSCHPDAGVKSLRSESFSGATVAKKPGAPGRARYSR